MKPMKDLSANIAGLPINPAITNASGIYPYPSMLKRLAEYDIGAVVTKSVTYDEREGHESPVFEKCSDGAYINAVGLSCPGYKQIKQELEDAQPIRKPLIVSLAADTENEAIEMIEAFDGFADAFEMNYSCPNISPGETCGMAIGKYPRRIESLTRAAKESTKKPIITKLPPRGDRFEFLESVDAAVSSGADAISAINTIADAMKINIEAKYPVLSNKYGGLSGHGIMPLGVGRVYMIREKYPDIPIGGIGGIKDAEDIIEYILAGADYVAIGTDLGIKTTIGAGEYLTSLIKKIEEYMDKNNIISLRELGGVAHEK